MARRTYWSSSAIVDLCWSLKRATPCDNHGRRKRLRCLRAMVL